MNVTSHILWLLERRKCSQIKKKLVMGKSCNEGIKSKGIIGLFLNTFITLQIL